MHATGASWAETDWLQISLLYDELARHDPSPVVRLNQAVAHAQVAGPADALPGWSHWRSRSPATTSSTPPGPSC